VEGRGKVEGSKGGEDQEEGGSEARRKDKAGPRQHESACVQASSARFTAQASYAHAHTHPQASAFPRKSPDAASGEAQHFDKHNYPDFLAQRDAGITTRGANYRQSK
jgi:hypothetical protein